MKTKLLILALSIAGVFICGLSSCVNPVACFTINVPSDSVHVNEQILFNGACSQKANEYIWQIQSSFDTSGSYDQSFSQTFTDSGNVTVSLTVINGGKTGFASETFKVIP